MPEKHGPANPWGFKEPKLSALVAGISTLDALAAAADPAGAAAPWCGKSGDIIHWFAVSTDAGLSWDTQYWTGKRQAPPA